MDRDNRERKINGFSFELGKLEGRTDASIEGLAHSLDDIRGFLRHLRCDEHHASLRSLTTHTRIHWGLFVGVAVALGWIIRELVGRGVQ